MLLRRSQKMCGNFVPGVEVTIPALVQVQDLLHELVSGKGDGLRWDTTDIVERQATVQSLFNPVLIIHMLKGLRQGARQKKFFFLNSTTSY